MGISLYYESMGPLAAEAKTAILKTVAQAATQQSWWCEPICLFDEDGGLQGSTKIFLPGYSTDDGGFREVDPEDDAIMAWRDTKRVIGILQQLSREHGLQWTLNIESEPLGTIDGTAGDQPALDKADEILLMADLEPDDASLGQRATEIDRRYADRW